ncbi:MAG: bifunctional proline dehydrogenase/L-glutamate gamma-semialdehyde dehydrogenase [Candidatus Hydrogenedentes bacterium]|nr:bifunctional proline dehydrogenase/L-glutamate gamma-semialdehyde dehydrogenase [Candidatus Hydrogenedentota bacterium]
MATTSPTIAEADRVRATAAELLRHMHDTAPSVFQPRALTGRLLNWVMHDPELKVDLFRLVDVLPSLRSAREIQAHISEYLRPNARKLPSWLGPILKFATGGLTAGLTAGAVRKMVEEVARQFIVGEDWTHALPRLRKLHESGLGATVDLVGEVTVSHEEADAYQSSYLGLIDALSEESQRWPSRDVLDRNHLGLIPRANVSLKLSALEPFLDPVDTAGSIARLRERVIPILLRARERNVFVNVDMETWALHGIILGFLEGALRHPELRAWPHVGVAVQAYLRNAQTDLDTILEMARQREAPITVRLVKGAYWEQEVIRARQHGYRVPVWESKSATDRNFERLSTFLFEHCEHLLPAFGSHNLRSVSFALTQAEALNVSDEAFEFQMLYGMAEPLRDALRERGHRVRVYAPIGELIPGMAYLVRRLLENTSNEGFLRQSYFERVDLEALLAAPETSPSPSKPAWEPRPDLSPPFTNCPHRDFTDTEERQRLAAAVERSSGLLPMKVPVRISRDGQHPKTVMERFSPNDRNQCVALVEMGTKDDAERAVEAAMAAWPSWRNTSVEYRAHLLETLAGGLWEDRVRLAALEVHEVGKPWTEADADVAEAIDFCRYYARRALAELLPEQIGEAPGEINQLIYEGRGPTVVIAPWNFPLAILCGMTTAALVAGNTVIMKPAEQSSATANALHEHLLDAGYPPNVVQFLPGRGEDVGPTLVEHPLTAQVAFTGSRGVGLSIWQRAAVHRSGQRLLKHVICEMGGKNAILVDEDADLDEAVQGVMISAFSYAGQKCSACSRVIVLQDIAHNFLDRLVEACRSLVVGPSTEPSCQLGPVIDEEAYLRLMEIIEDPGTDVEVLYRGSAPSDNGYFVPPLVVKATDCQCRLMQDELFGPILCVLVVSSFDGGLDTALSSDFALTGGVYSRRPSHIEEARRRFRVGNLYVNRPCTGSMVGRQAFGGFDMSGGGTKAGGPGYLRHFVNPVCITENTVRRGFAPDLTT